MADVFIPKWKEGNGSSFMKNLEKYLKYEVDLEKSEVEVSSPTVSRISVRLACWLSVQRG